MTQYVANASEEVPIESYDDLVRYFEAACKPRELWRIGTEYEKVGVRAADGAAAPFTGGIEEILRRMADRYGWSPVLEDGRVVALAGKRASITLEPGGQLELSGEQWRDVHEAGQEFHEHVRQIVSVAGELGIVFLGLGMQPVSRVEEIEWVPKRRYRIMAPYMEKVGSLGHRMMKQTATVQVNIDFSSEADAMEKLRLGNGLAPLLNAIFANSPLCDGDLNGFLSFRGHIWTDTDPARCGLLPFVFADSPGFSDYVEYALDVPMYFIVRGDRWIDMTHMTFREFWQRGFEGERATLADWNSHLTTLFPEARMKRYIEIRSVDSQPPEIMLAVPALVKGVFYDGDARLAAWDLVKRWRWEERLQLYHDAHRQALRAKIRNLELRELARELVDIAEYGLDRQRPPGGESEAMYLEQVRDYARKGICPAERVIEKWIGTWNRDPARLVQALAYRTGA
ncbi:MAG: glutamate--cysteine ligase [Candidatus Binatia bacterium]|nr:MAG: glutamate--cysteine ligase [Candidatus Binatia bacterium]